MERIAAERIHSAIDCAWTAAGQRDYLRAYDGGPGLRYLMATFAPRLRRRLGDAAADAILVANPARFYAFPTGAAR